MCWTLRKMCARVWACHAEESTTCVVMGELRLAHWPHGPVRLYRKQSTQHGPSTSHEVKSLPHPQTNCTPKAASSPSSLSFSKARISLPSADNDLSSSLECFAETMSRGLLVTHPSLRMGVLFLFVSHIEATCGQELELAHITLAHSIC